MKDNITADAMTLASARALRAMKQKLRDEGRANDERMHGLRSAIGEHLSEHPELLERATKDVERWRSKFKTNAQKPSG